MITIMSYFHPIFNCLNIGFFPWSKRYSLSCDRLFTTHGLFIIAQDHQAPVSRLSRQGYWSGLPFPSPRNTVLDSSIFCPDSSEVISSKASAVFCLGCLQGGQTLLQLCTPGLNRWPGTTVHRGTDGAWAGELGYPLCACKAPHPAEQRQARGMGRKGGRLRAGEPCVTSCKSKLGLPSCYEAISVKVEG